MLYKNYDQEALDRQYNLRLHTPDFADYFERWDLLSRQTEKKYPVDKDISYSTLPLEQSDIYPSSQAHSKTLVFIHGGYWHLLDKTAFHFIADVFHADNITTVLLNYPLAPACSMDQIVLSCRKSVAWLYENIIKYNGDPNHIYIAGHSAGGHLAAMLMATDWPRFNPFVPGNIIKGVCALSGLFNLTPVRLCYINQIVGMNDETAARNSPVNLHPMNTCPLILAVGAAETTEFIEQSTELAICWEQKNCNAQLMQIPGKNHYSILDTIIDKEAELHLAIRELIKL
jgi:arylformamidase